MQVAAHQRLQRRRAGPEIIIQRCGHGLWPGHLADALPHPVQRRPDDTDLAQSFPFQVDRTGVMAMTLVAPLHDALVLLRRSTVWRPSKILCESGFSTYTSLPA